MDEDELIAEDEKRRIAALRKTAPETIWLQIDEEAEQFDGWDAQTWCTDQINDTDLKYVRTDVVEELRMQLVASTDQVTAAVEACRLKDEYLLSAKAMIGHPDNVAIIERGIAIHPDYSALPKVMK